MICYINDIQPHTRIAVSNKIITKLPSKTNIIYVGNIKAEYVDLTDIPNARLDQTKVNNWINIIINKLIQTPEIDIEKYIKIPEVDPVAEFMQDAVIYNSSVRINSTTLYDAYKEYRLKLYGDEKPCSNINFSKTLTAPPYNLKKTKISLIYFEGIKIRDEYLPKSCFTE